VGVLTYATADNAWLATPEPEAVAAAIESALDVNPARVEAARQTAEPFAWPVVVAAYFALQDRLLASPPSLARQPRNGPAGRLLFRYPGARTQRGELPRDTTRADGLR
jgi:hypothetical protein